MPQARDARGRFTGSGGATFRAPSEAVLAARERRAATSANADVRIEWFIQNVTSKLQMTAKQRVLLATNYLRDRVVKNISRPVTVGVGPRGGRVVVDRSKPGEYPKADTTQLLKSIFAEVRETSPGDWTGYVGTALDYGIILETSMRLDRAFLVPTLNAERAILQKFLTGPTKL